MKPLAGLSAALLLLVAASPAAAEVHYTGAALRDPFGGQVETANRSEEGGVSEADVRGLVIRGIVAASSNPRAIINDRIYRVGEEPLAGVKIARIDKSGVYFTAGQKEIFLKRQTPTTKGTSDDAFSKSSY